MSRITSGKVRLDVQPVEPAAVIEAAVETVRPAADAKGIRLEKLLDPGAGPISGDPGPAAAGVWNLLSNAIKFTPQGRQGAGAARARRTRTSRSAWPTPASASSPSSSRTCSSASARPTPRPRAGTAGSGSACRSSSTWSSCTAARSRVQSAGEGRGATFTVQLAARRGASRRRRGRPVASEDAAARSLRFQPRSTCPGITRAGGRRRARRARADRARARRLRRRGAHRGDRRGGAACWSDAQAATCW